MTTQLGCDISFWQGQVDFDQMRGAGAQFVFIRAGQGSAPDPRFAANWQGAQAAGIPRGAYLFYDYTRPAAGQARFLAQMLAADWGELPPVLDVEIHPRWGRPPRAGLLRALRTFLDTFAAAGAPAPLLYTNPDVILHLLAPVPAWLLRCPLWVAHYRTAVPRIGPWPSWRYWQFTDRGGGRAFGVQSQQIDLDWGQAPPPPSAAVKTYLPICGA